MRRLFMVEGTMKPYLEEEHGFKLTIHQRDFNIGVLIMHNIINAIQENRRMIMLISK